MWCILAVAFLLHPPHLLLGAGLCAVMAESYLSLPLLSAYLSAFLTCANQPFRPLLRSRRPASALLAAVCDGTHDGNFCHFCPCCGAVAATGDDAVAVVVAPFLGVAVMVPVRPRGRRCHCCHSWCLHFQQQQTDNPRGMVLMVVDDGQWCGLVCPHLALLGCAAVDGALATGEGVAIVQPRG